jgi:hypothetical protein
MKSSGKQKPDRKQIIRSVVFMKNFKKLAAVVTLIGLIGGAGAVYAATTTKTPAEIAAGLTGKSVGELNKERAAGKTYGTIVQEAGKLEEFKTQMLAQKKAILDQRVKDGTLTQKEADAIYKAIKDNQAICNGTGNAGIGRKSGAGFGRGCGVGRGQDSCGGAGMGYGRCDTI